MKFKFKADAKDVVTFIIFAIFLLYVVALGVLNFPELAINGRFFGLNPFPAFSSSRIFSTIVFYFFALAALFMSVSSYFFEREKGFGFSTEKNEKGYSRWAKEKEIKEDKGIEMVRPGDKNATAAGIPLILKKDEVWVDNGEYHNLVIGATGSGKTQTVIFPTVELLAKKRESMIITDPKGEIYESTSNMLREKGYNVLILNFRDPQQGNAWNPLSLPYRIYKSGNQDKAIELLDDLASNILYEEKSGNADPFWEKTSADYFSGLALGMFEDTTEDKVNLNSISLMTTVGEEKFGGSTYIKEYFNTKDPASPAYTNASGTIMAPNETKGSIISVFKQKIKLFASRENLSEMLSHSDFNLETIGEEPTALFIVIQDEKKTYHSLVTILLKQCYETLISVAQRHGGKLPVRTNFLLDEFANMPPLKDITTMITAARSRQIRFTMIIQNFAQLDQVYGKENAETIKGNCGNIIYLITTELKALEEISKMCGEVKSKKDDKTASTPLVTISDLQRMKQFEVIILRMRKNPFKTKFVPYFQMEFGKKYPKAEYPQREKVPVNTFDIREFVKEKKKQKLFEMMNSETGGNGGMLPNGMQAGNPFGGSPNGNPFGGMLGNSNQQQAKKPGGFNVDDLVKKIDAKIAEIEREEKEKQQQKEQQTGRIRGQVSSGVDSTQAYNPVASTNFNNNISNNINNNINSNVNPFNTPVNQTQVKPREPMSIDDILKMTSPFQDKEIKKEEEKSSPVVSNKPVKKEIEQLEDTTDFKPVKPTINESNIPPKREVDITDDQFFDDFFDDED